MARDTWGGEGVFEEDSGRRKRGTYQDTGPTLVDVKPWTMDRVFEVESRTLVGREYFDLIEVLT